MDRTNAGIVAKLDVIKAEEEKRMKKRQFLLHVPDIVQRSRERLEKLNAQGKIARQQAVSTREVPKWAVKHNK